MCRTTDNHSLYYQNQNPNPNPKRDCLKIKAFYFRLLLSNSNTNTTTTTTPKTITLHYLPRISGSPLEINDFKIRSNLDAFVTLHRVRSSADNELVFASRECVRVSEAVSFHVYFREDKVLKGIFRKDQHRQDWKLQCQCALPLPQQVGGGGGVSVIDAINEAEVSIAAEGHMAINEKVDMKRRRRRRNKCRNNRIIGFNSKNRGLLLLDEIPEETEEDEPEFYCCCHEEENQMESDDFTVKTEQPPPLPGPGMGWAVDVGIWVMCFGVGLLLSKASSKRLTKILIS